MRSETIPASMEYLNRVMSVTGQILEEAGCREEDRRLIEISVEELFTNIASYAYDKKEGTVWMRWEIREAGEEQKEVIICLQDEGISYDPFVRKDPDLTLPMEERPVGGLGIYMVKQFMDHVEHRYQEGRNITTIRKAFRSDKEA